MGVMVENSELSVELMDMGMMVENSEFVSGVTINP